MQMINGILAIAIPAAELATFLRENAFLDTIAPLWIRWQSSAPATIAMSNIDHLVELLKSL